MIVILVSCFVGQYGEMYYHYFPFACSSKTIHINMVNVFWFQPEIYLPWVRGIYSYEKLLYHFEKQYKTIKTKFRK